MTIGPHRRVSPILTTLVLGALMLLAVGVFIRRDVSWRGSLGLGRQPVGSVVGWSLFGFGGTYAVNLLLSVGYLISRGGLEAQAAGRVRWLEYLADIPVEAILPARSLRRLLGRDCLSRFPARPPASGAAGGGHAWGDASTRRPGRGALRTLLWRGPRLPGRVGPHADDDGRDRAGGAYGLARKPLARHRRPPGHRYLRPSHHQGGGAIAWGRRGPRNDAVRACASGPTKSCPPGGRCRAA